VAAQVKAQSVSDFAGVAAKEVDAVTALCRSIARDLGAPQADQDAADAQPDADGKVKAWCDLAANTIEHARGTAGGAFTVSGRPPICQKASNALSACQQKCAGAGCDAQCTQRCNANCDASAWALADCPTPTVTVAIEGPANQTVADKLRMTLEANLGPLLEHWSRVDEMAKVTGTVNGGFQESVVPKCLPTVAVAAVHAVTDANVAAAAADAVLQAAAVL
jgi:hypothetical protein